MCSSVSDNEQGSSVLSQSRFFVQCRLSPCCNLGYLAVISLAHCHSYFCCWVGAFWSFCLVLSSLPFILTPVEVSSESNQLAGKLTLPVQELGGHSGSFLGGSCLNKRPWLNIKWVVHLRGNLLQTCTPERYWSIWRDSSSPR